MAKVGYIFLAEAYESVESDKAWMEKFGCVKIVEENAEDEKLRPEWKALLMSLERGDELVLSKFSNALRGTRTFLLPRTMPYQGDTHYLYSRQG